MLLVVAPVDHVFPVASEEVMVTEPPSQKVVGPPAVITGAKPALSTIVIGAEEPEQPFPSNTESVIVALASTTMLLLVSVVDQVFPELAEDVKVTLPPVQKVVGPLGVITATGF